MEFNNLVSDNINNLINNSKHEEYQYLHLIENIIENGVWEEGRNGKTKCIFGNTMRFSLKDGTIPILTTKKTAWKTCLKELLWFLHGETDTNKLVKQGVHIWDGNTSREFLDSRGLHLYPEGMIGPSYGYQWRKFGASYNCFTGSNITEDHPFGGIDQLQYIIDQLKNPETRNNRRLIMTAWNPKQLEQMALPPCHILCQFRVYNGNQLSCALFQRSNDCALGTSFNIASYSFLTHLLAKHCGLEAVEFIHFMGDCHLYEEHIGPMKNILNKEPFVFPKINIKEVKENINDYTLEDFDIIGYKCHDVIKMKMVA